MAKSKLHLSIDSDKIARAKQHIPNLSIFFEECLDIYLESNIDEIELARINRTIMKANFERELYMKSRMDKKYIEKDKTQRKNKVWGQLYNSYSQTKEYDWELMKEAIELLEQSEEVLVGMMDTLIYDNSNSFDKLKTLKDWDYTVSLFDDVE